jgi:hypothetical protein
MIAMKVVLGMKIVKLREGQKARRSLRAPFHTRSGVGCLGVRRRIRTKSNRGTHGAAAG